MNPALSLVDPENSSPKRAAILAKPNFVHRSPSRPNESWNWQASGTAEIERAVSLGRNSLPRWRATPADQRFKLLRKFADTLATHRDELANLIFREVGKPICHARGEVARAIALIESTKEQIDRDQDRQPDKTGYRREPLGLVALITPFNNPLAIPVGKFIPSLLYGNVVVWKPAIAGSAIGQRAADLFKSATDFPELLQLIVGEEETARSLIELADAVTISGSQKAGRSAQQLCIDRYLPFQAEMGGNNAAIVWNDADLQQAAAKISEGAFGFAGQRCTANRRVIVDSTIWDEFLQLLVDETRRLGWGDPADEATQVGPVISTSSRERIERVVARAEADSLQVLRPFANVQSPSGDTYFAPTIICCDDPGHEIVQEETFGPVLVAQRVKDWDDAISLCNSVRQGLAAALFSSSQRRIADFLQQARAGVLKINLSTSDAAVDMPFGGWKSSGVGPAEHGPSNREFFTRAQTIYFS